MVTDPTKKPYDRIREHLMSSRHKKFKTASKEAETAGTSQQTLFDMSCRQRAKETEADGVIHDFVRALAYSGISMHQADGPLGDFARKYCKAAKTMPTGQRLRLKYLKEAFDKDMEKIRGDMRDVKVSVIVDESPDITGVPTINTLLCYYSQKNEKKHVVLVDVDRVNASNSYTVASAVSKALLTVGKTWKDVVAVATDSAEYMRKMVREICQAEGIQILHVKDIAHLIHTRWKSLRDKFRRLCVALKAAHKNEAGAEDTKELDVAWLYFDMMVFLKDSVEGRPTHQDESDGVATGVEESLHSERKFIVFESFLRELLANCPVCGKQ
ncbi:hypothetical protein HPB52_006183 [Rhipicephalus sanguineus]|uniref:MADF domain-containing protein n=1 Tax=Rhipicephalus sanguineus TaxID=34632 RepID=A0A9D4T712_RHISA|nr:hypothetical protein HPB52_006183 [Rhipicephalus sanguineus]